MKCLPVLCGSSSSQYDDSWIVHTDLLFLYAVTLIFYVNTSIAYVCILTLNADSASLLPDDSTLHAIL